MSFGWCILLFLYGSGSVSSFPAYDIVGERNTKSHSSITLEAIYKATATFLERAQLINDTELSLSLKISKFFGSDGDSLNTFIKTIREISNYMGNFKRDNENSSRNNVNGEQILMAHRVINILRYEVRELSSNLTIVRNNITLIREKIAHILYIVQEFYSNTNWIELHGSTIYEDFGQEGRLKEEMATSRENTCTNCGYVNGVEQCKNNTLGTKLTSGYKSGQDVSKPFKRGTDGKCSHGTPDDASRNIAATGGIYKGRSIQNEAPHSYLHQAAVEAAVKATEYYIIDQDRGLQQMMGSEVFRDVFSIRTRENIFKTSLTYVIDVTGSMGDDIEKVKTATAKIVKEAKDSEFVPNNYILVTFSDPANLTTGKSTSDPFTMLEWLKYIFVGGGGDCPEYAMTGLLKGIEMSNNNSNIYLLTDADAKDEHLKNQVLNGLMEKHLTPIFILTGQCSRRKREISRQYYISSLRSSGEQARYIREKRSSTSVFESIARETGGTVYEINVSEVEDIVEKEIKETFPSSNVYVTWIEIPSGFVNITNVSIPVDGYIETLKLTVNPVTSKSEVDLYYPNGTVVSFISKYEESELSGIVLALSIRNPEAGQWGLQKKGRVSWLVNVTAQSAVDFSIDVLEADVGGNSHQLTGNPIKGNRYIVVVDIQNFNANSSCTGVVLLDVSGNDVTEITVTRIPNIGIARYMGDFVPFNKVSDTRTADCTIIEYPARCPQESLNTENCSVYNWTSSAEVSSSKIQESEIKVSSDEVILDYMNLTDANFSVGILISGHCCIQSVVLSITDKNGYFDQCDFVLSNQPLTVVVYPTKEIPTTVKEATTVTTTDEQVSSNYPTTDILLSETSTTDIFTTVTTKTDKQNQEDDSAAIGTALGFSFLGLILVLFMIILFCKIKGSSNYNLPVVLSKYRNLKEDGTNVLEVDVKLPKCQKPYSTDLGDEIDSSNTQGSELEKKMSEDKSIPTNSVNPDTSDIIPAANQNAAYCPENDEKNKNDVDQNSSTVSFNLDNIQQIDTKSAEEIGLEGIRHVDNNQVDGTVPAQQDN
uniref:von Willebrand factor A domain-containing protein 7-like isoform X3 n=1 Tax=Crassostrea virginica TaxID=6565 RepID=A0A8B8AB49_CRAVI|nr:von Willebrand factor A domain-containing protein 7-like isoform X3 [Crassostrea virginica]